MFGETVLPACREPSLKMRCGTGIDEAIAAMVSRAGCFCSIDTSFFDVEVKRTAGRGTSEGGEPGITSALVKLM